MAQRSRGSLSGFEPFDPSDRTAKVEGYYCVAGLMARCVERAPVDYYFVSHRVPQGLVRPSRCRFLEP
jgi:hypothetical protein